MFGTGIGLLLYTIWTLEGEFIASPLILNLNLPLNTSEVLKGKATYKI